MSTHPRPALAPALALALLSPCAPAQTTPAQTTPSQTTPAQTESAHSTSSQTGPYQVRDHWHIGGTGGWDYLLADSAAHRLYVTHGPRVEVLDTRSGKLIGSITGLKGTHGIVLDPNKPLGYISDGQSNEVVLFDRNSLQIVGHIPTGTNPDGMAWEPTTNTLWAFNGRSNTVSIIDPNTRTVLATTPLPGKPEFPQADGRGNVFVNIEDKNSVVRLSAGTHQVLQSIPLQNCDSPSGSAFDPAHHRLFSVCDGGRMAVLDTTTLRQIASASIGDGPDAAAYSPARQLAFSSNGGSGTLSVIDVAHGYRTLQTLPTGKGARTMAYDAATDTIYLVTARFGPPPAPSPAQPRPRPSILPDSFEVLVVSR